MFPARKGELEQNQHPGVGMARYYRVVELAMESKSEDVVEAALGQLHKLIGEPAISCLAQASHGSSAFVTSLSYAKTGLVDRWVLGMGTFLGVVVRAALAASPLIVILCSQFLS